MRILSFIAINLSLLAFCGCNQGSDFTGNNAKKTPPAQTKSPQVSDPQDSNGSPADGDQFSGGDQCTESGVTKVRLLTESIPNQAPQQWIEYDVRLEDCDGNLIPVVNRPILFDLDASISPNVVNISYSISNIAGETPFSTDGELLYQPNKDLFGKTGSNYAHWMTEPVTINSQHTALHLTIKMSNLLITSLNDSGIFEFSVPSYLRFGDAAPVQQDVKIKN